MRIERKVKIQEQRIQSLSSSLKKEQSLQQELIEENNELLKKCEEDMNKIQLLERVNKVLIDMIKDDANSFRVKRDEYQKLIRELSVERAKYRRQADNLCKIIKNKF